MTKKKHILVLNGSPKKWGGTSKSLGDYILGKLPDARFIKETHHVGNSIRKEQDWARVITAVIKANTIILTFPLYWDSLPSHLIKGLEEIYENRKEKALEKEQNFYVIVNNGFPEPYHNETAIDICRQFALEADFEWKGAMNIGGGAAINGKPLEETGGITYKLRETLDIATSAIEKGEAIPQEVEDRLKKPLYPPWVNIIFGGIGWRSQAKKKGVKTSLKARPYE